MDKSSQNGVRPPSATMMASIIIGWRSKSFWTSSMGRWSHVFWRVFFHISAYWHSSPDVRDLVEHHNTCSQIQSRQACSHEIAGDIRLVRDPQNQSSPLRSPADDNGSHHCSWRRTNSVLRWLAHESNIWPNRCLLTPPIFSAGISAWAAK